MKKRSDGADASVRGPDLPARHRPGQSPADRLLRVKPGCAGRATGSRGRSPGQGHAKPGLTLRLRPAAPWGGSTADGKIRHGPRPTWCAGGGSPPRAPGSTQPGDRSRSSSRPTRWHRMTRGRTARCAEVVARSC